MSAIDQVLQQHRELVDRLDALGVPGRPASGRVTFGEAAGPLQPASGPYGGSDRAQGAWRVPDDEDEVSEVEALPEPQPTDEEARAEQAQAVTHLADALIAHLLVEELILYPAACPTGIGDLVTEALTDHANLRALVRDLSRLDPADEPARQAGMHRLRDVLDAHVDLVEQRLLPALETELGEERLEELGMHMEAKHQVLRAPERRFEAADRTPPAPAGRGSSR